MSHVDDEQPLELHMFAPDSNDEIAELLVVTAHYHRTGQRLDLGHSVNFGRAWWRASLCDRGLLSHPYLDGPKLEWLEANGKRVRFLWVVPVTKSEIDFKKSAGLEALEKRFEEQQFDYVNPLRPSVV